MLLAATNTDPDAVHPLLRKHLRRRIVTPTLAEHREDIPLLMRMLIRRNHEEAGAAQDAEFWAEYTRVCSHPRVIERLVREDYQNGGVFMLDRRMNEEARDFHGRLGQSP